jgi:hypothetical protein
MLQIITTNSSHQFYLTKIVLKLKFILTKKFN